MSESEPDLTTKTLSSGTLRADTVETKDLSASTVSKDGLTGEPETKPGDQDR